MRQAVDHLVGLGIGGSSSSPPGRCIRPMPSGWRGFARPRRRMGSTPNCGSRSRCRGPARRRRAGAHPSRTGRRRPYVSTTVAAGLSNGLTDRGIEVGSDISIVGFDNLVEAELVRPRLTSIAAFPEAIGETAAGLLLDRLAAPQRPLAADRQPDGAGRAPVERAAEDPRLTRRPGPCGRRAVPAQAAALPRAPRIPGLDSTLRIFLDRSKENAENASRRPGGPTCTISTSRLCWRPGTSSCWAPG